MNLNIFASLFVALSLAISAAAEIGYSEPVGSEYVELNAVSLNDSLGDLVKITGNGFYPPGKKVTLKCSCSDKRALFVGWFDEDGDKVSSNTSYSFTMPDYDFYPSAYYILPQDDYLNGCTESFEGVYGQTFEEYLIASFNSESDVTVKVSGLPSGLKTHVVKSDNWTTEVYVSGKLSSTKGENCWVTVTAKNKTGWKLTLIEPWSLNGGADFLVDDILDSKWTGDVIDHEFDEEERPKSITGLPKGISYNAKTGLLSGTLTTPGVYHVKYTYASGSEIRTALIYDDGSGYINVIADDDNGTVSGSGVYFCGETLKLSAKPKKGYVFAGWKDVDFGPLDEILKTDARSAEISTIADYQIINIGEIRGCFEEAENDTFVDFSIDAESEWSFFEDDAFFFTVESVSLPKVTMKGAPSGVQLKIFNGNEYELCLDDTKTVAPGVYPITLTAVNQSKVSASVVVTLTIPNWVSEEVGEVFDKEFTAGLAVMPYDVGDNPEGLTVKGLPAGLKYNAKNDAKTGVAAGTVTGKPTKAGYYTVTFSRKIGKTTYSATATYIVREDTTLYFNELDGETFVADGEFELDLGERLVTATDPKITVKGLPSGLKYDSKTFKITGTSSKPGRYTVTAAATNYSVKKATEESTAVFTITVANLRSGLYDGVLDYENAYELTVGLYSYQLGALNDNLCPNTYDCYKISVSGLPSGLKFKEGRGCTSDGYFTGVPTKAGDYTVTITTTIGKTKYTDTILLSVKGLPEWAVGTFQGGVESGAEIGGLVDFTVSSVGKISGKVNVDGQTYAFAGDSYSSFDGDAYGFGDISIKVGNEWMDLNIYVNDGGFYGELGDYTFYGSRVQWKDSASAAELKKVYALVKNAYKARGENEVTCITADGLTLKLSDNGQVAIAGKLNYYYATASATLLDTELDSEYLSIYGCVFIYVPPKSGAFDGYYQLVEAVFE